MIRRPKRALYLAPHGRTHGKMDIATVASHFQPCGTAGTCGGSGSAGKQVRCRHCGTGVRGAVRDQRKHLARCASVSADDRRVMNECEVARAAAGAGMYGSNPVYRDFEVMGYLISCGTVQGVLKGGERFHVRMSAAQDPQVCWCPSDVARGGCGQSLHALGGRHPGVQVLLH